MARANGWKNKRGAKVHAWLAKTAALAVDADSGEVIAHNLIDQVKPTMPRSWSRGLDRSAQVPLR